MPIDREKNPRPYEGIQEAKPCNYRPREHDWDHDVDDWNEYKGITFAEWFGDKDW